MRDHRRDLGIASRPEIREVHRQVEAAIVGHQVLDAVEIAAEGKVVDALLAVTALPVNVDRDEARALVGADGDMRNPARAGIEYSVALLPPHP